MLIDFHTHSYADKIAEKVIATVTGTAPFVKAYTNGTAYDERRFLKECGVDIGVLLMVATKPSQQTVINDWAKEQNRDGLISVGSVHPYAENVLDEIERIKSLGLKGVKIHHDYQGVFIFDEKCMAVYKRCEELGLPIVFHMGYDPISPYIHRAMPYDLIEISEKFPKLRIVGAHMGGMNAWESVLHYIAGIKNIYLDVSFVAPYIDKALCNAIIKKHGADRILFGSDLPWGDPREAFELVAGLDIPDSDKEKIYWKNAAELLELEI